MGFWGREGGVDVLSVSGTVDDNFLRVDEYESIGRSKVIQRRNLEPELRV